MIKPQALYLIAGLGKTGRSIAGYLQRRGLPFVAYDTREAPTDLAEFKQAFPEVDVYLAKLPKSIYPQLSTVIASPGVPLTDPVLTEACRLGLPVIGDIECLAREISAPVIAITGTNGKSTVTTLVGEMLTAHGLKVAVAGNIGTPVLDLLDDGQHYDAWVLELSSFQLDLIQSLAPLASTILNISADHLDRHANLEAYIAAKQRIYQRSQHCLYNREEPLTYPEGGADSLMSFGLSAASVGNWGLIKNEAGTYLAKGDTVIFSVDELRIKGQQNWKNALAACALAETLGVKPEEMVSVLQTFSGLAHRCQWVRTLDAIDWINDSKGTNIGASIAAIEGIGNSILGKIVLIAGGLGKGADFKELSASVASFVRSMVLIGKDAPRIAEALAGIVPIVHADSLENAILQARTLASGGDVVLLSPACASQDMFVDFNHRGLEFTNLVSLL